VTTRSPTDDTDPEVRSLMEARWRSLDVAERVGLIRAMCDEVDVLARAGIRFADPKLTEVGVARELTRRRYGSELAEAAYGVESHR
jgi:hypothetical protein